MNLGNLLERMYQAHGYPDTSSTRTAASLQTYKDLINQVQDEICATCSPSLDFLTREVTLTVTAGTTDYLISDWCQRPLSVVESTYGRRIPCRRMINVDEDGSRNPQLTGISTLEQYVPVIRTSTAVLSNKAGATTGATAAEGTYTAAIGSANDVLTSASVGRMMKFNGESGDYKILSVSSRTATLDRPIISRVSGTGPSTTAGSGYAAASCRWEIGPKGRYWIRFLPSIGNSPIVRYMAYPRKLLSLTDEPEFQEDMHHLIWKGAMLAMGAQKENDRQYQIWSNEYEKAIALLKKSDADDASSNDGPTVERLEDWIPSGVQRGTDYHRRLGF